MSNDYKIKYPKCHWYKIYFIIINENKYKYINIIRIDNFKNTKNFIDIFKNIKKNLNKNIKISYQQYL